MTDLHKLLYVEDDDAIAEVTILALQELGGFEIRHCTSGQQALDCVSSFAPQLILMDVMMPGMDGPEAMRLLQQIPEASDIPVVFMTARAQTHEQEAYLLLGAAGVIVKPFDPMTLADQVREIWLGSR